FFHDGGGGTLYAPGTTNTPILLLPTFPTGSNLPYGKKEALFTADRIGTPVPGRPRVNDVVGVLDAGVHAYLNFGDASGSGDLGGQAATLINQVANGSGSGFVAYQNLDPVIVGDTSGSGDLGGQDATQVNVKANGGNAPTIPSVVAGNSVPANVPDPR